MPETRPGHGFHIEMLKAVSINHGCVLMFISVSWLLCSWFTDCYLSCNKPPRLALAAQGAVQEPSPEPHIRKRGWR